ncbi:hypothetical protein HK098_004548 [Nowakowskiella sp. JEL0407]|nr:hypothetical protein HK098_004548 [Nowakowskiella sp. JEL0407]
MENSTNDENKSGNSKNLPDKINIMTLKSSNLPDNSTVSTDPPSPSNLIPYPFSDADEPDFSDNEFTPTANTTTATTTPISGPSQQHQSEKHAVSFAKLKNIDGKEEKHSKNVGFQRDFESDDDEEDEDGTQRRSFYQRVISAENAAEQVKKSGFLKKRDTKRRIWRKRWFVLRTTRIAYYKSEKEYELLGVIDLDKITAVAEIEAKRTSNVFGIVTPEKTFFVRTQSAEDMHDWISIIKASYREVQRTSVGSSTSGVGVATSSTSPKRVSVRSNSITSPSFQPHSILKQSSKQQSFESPSSLIIPSSTTASTSPTEEPSEETATKPYISRNSDVSLPSTNASLLTFATTPSVVVARNSTSSQTHSVTFAPEVSFDRCESPTDQNNHDVRNGSTSEHHVRSLSDVDDTTPTDGHVFSEDDEDEEEEEEEHYIAGINGDNKVILQGYLNKRAGPRYNKNWKRRWFVLRNATLTCYKDENEYVVSRLIPLRTVIDIIKTPGKGPKHNYCFKLVRPKRSLLVACETQDQLDLWFSELKKLHTSIDDDD